MLHGGFIQAQALGRRDRGRPRDGVDGVQQNKVQRVDASRPNKDNASV